MLRDDDAIQIFVEESEEHLADIESDLLAIEKGGSEIDDDLINKVFRAVHTVKGGSGFLGYETIKILAHKMENIMGLIRSRDLEPNSGIVSILLAAADALQNLVQHLDSSNETDVSKHLKALASIIESSSPVSESASGNVVEKKSTPVPPSPAVKQKTVANSAQVNAVKPKVKRDKESVQIFVEESEEHLADIESDLLAIEKGGSEIDDDLVNKVFRAVHTVKGGAGFLSYQTIKNLAHKMENVMGMIREHKLEPTAERISILLSAADSLHTMIQNLENSDTTDVSEHLQALAIIAEDNAAVVQDRGGQAKTSVKKPTVSIVSPPELKQQKEKKSAEGSLRVSIHLLDQLMNLAGELVLSRNQLVQAVASKNMESIELVKQRIDSITSELQESIMFTRMQPIGTVFNRFPRLTRELTMQLGKEVELSIEGEGVELDKTILEAISAPLTHLIRNSLDHGIEMPEDRQRAGKDKKGKVILRASHEAGMVILEVVDDGQGMDPEKIASSLIKKGIFTEEQIQHLSDKEKLHLIFLPGFSTSESVTEISGRGVGMDVVKTNLDKLGGQIDISSKPGKGTSIRIKLPLTLAIISAQIIICGNERYSIPQVNLEELLQVPANEIKDRVEIIGKASVLKLRGNLLPLVKLADVLNKKTEYVDALSGEIRTDRRKNIADRRSPRFSFGKEQQATVLATSQYNNDYTQRKSDRRYHKSSALHVAIVNTGNLKYGLVVDALKDAEEIVVKPLGRHLQSSKKYSGATIMGDGCVSLILDVGNIAREAGLISFENSERALQLSAEMESSARKLKDLQSFLLFRNGGDNQYGVPLNLVLRVIKIQSSEIECISGKRVLQYQEESLPLFSIDEVANVPPLEDREDLLVIIFKVAGREVGLLATKPVNAMEMVFAIDGKTHQEPGIMGSVIINKQITLLVNIYDVVKVLHPQWFTSQITELQVKRKNTILIAEDSAFFQNQIAKTLQEEGFNTIVAEDGQSAWEKLEENAEKISLLVTDIEMPRLNGFKLTERIREDDRFKTLPIIALTTLAGDEDFKRGKRAGVDEYHVKFNRDLLVDNVIKLLGI